MNKRKRIGRQLLCLIVSFVMIMTLIPRMPGNLAYAAAGDVPAHTKNLTDNHDGTFTLSLDVVGDSEKKPNNINVVVILDRSGSMNTTRMNSAKSAIKSLSNKLYSYNTSSEPNTVEMALVTFSNIGEVAQSPTNSSTTFNSAVDNVRATGGTNWEGALQIAKGVDFGDNDQTFVVFVSDGNPTFRFTEGDYPNHRNDYNSTYYYNYGVWGTGDDDDATTVARCYEHAVDDAKALAQQVGVNNFFTIGAFGNVDRMKSLTTDAGAPAKNYYSASDSAALNQAISDILAKIEMAGIANAEIDDGTTNKVTTTSGKIAKLLEVDESSFKYYKGGSAWADAPEAHLVNGTVEWDLESAGVLENGVRYTVTFDCYPSQYTYDTIAKLKNGDITYDSLDSEIKKYIADLGEGNYGLRTNTDATLSYDDTRDDAGVQTVGYKNPDPVGAGAQTLTVNKEWKGGNPDVESLNMTVLMDGEPFHETELNTENNWSSSSFISVGIIKNGQVLSGAEGHDFTFAELDGTQYHWELDAPTVHPMLVNGTMTMLIKVDATHQAPAGATTYTINGSTYYVDTATTGLTATNNRRSNLNLTKTVTGNAAPADAEFPFTLTVNNSKAPATEPTDDPKHNSDYWVWFSIYDTKAGATVTDATVSAAGLVGPNDDGYYYAPSGTAITVDMKDGWNLRFTNLPSGTTYTFAEGNMPTGFTFKESTLSGGTDSTFSGAKTTTGTIETTKSSYYVTYTNQYNPVKLVPQVTKKVTGWNAKKAFTFNIAPKEGDTATATAIRDGYIVMPENVEATTKADLKNGESQTVDFEAIEFLREGTYKFTISEIITDVPDGWTYDSSTKDITVVVTADKDGKLVAEIQEETPVFENKYEAGPTEGVQIPVVKNVTPENSGAADITGKFTFTLTAGTNTAGEGVVTPMPSSNTVLCGADGEEVKFGAITFTKPGVYTYTVTESETNGPVGGITMDTEKPRTVTVTVTDDGTGTLKAEVNGETAVTFNNPYSVQSLDITIPVEKILEVPEELTGPDITNKYTFTIADDESDDVTSPLPTKSSTLTNPGAQGGTMTFGEEATTGKITVTQPGTYTYTVTEHGSVDGVTNEGCTAEEPHEDVVKTVVVTVTDNGDGTMSYKINDPEDETDNVTTFTNIYSADPVTDVTFPVEKVLTVPEGAVDAPEEWTYTFNVAASEGAPEAEVMSADVDQDNKTATFGPFVFNAPGTYTYTVTESGTVEGVVNDAAAADGKTVTVEVADGKEGSLVVERITSTDEKPLTFTNTYHETGITISVNKEIAAEGLDGPKDVEGKFHFTITGSEGAPLPEKKTIDYTSKGSMQFGTITFNEEGTYIYTVTETGEVPGVTNDEPKTVTVNVTRGEDGELTAAYDGATSFDFVNTYKVEPTTASFPVKKALEITGLGPKSWSYTINVAANGGAPEAETMTGTVTNENDTVTFGDFKFTAPGKYTYTVTETGKVAGVENDSAATTGKTVTINVVDNGDGTLTAIASSTAEEPLTFTNTYTYKSTTATIQVHKDLVAENPKVSLPDITGEYTFTLAADGEAPMPKAGEDTVTNPAATGGTVAFGTITYTEPGTYTYVVTEEGSVNNVTNDPAAATGKTVTVNVVDGQEGELVATVTYPDPEKGEVDFTNTYKADPVTVSFPVEKVLDVPEELDGPETWAYTFNVTADKEGTPVAESMTANVDQDNTTATFGPFSYTEPGEYTYTVKETGTVEGVTNDADAAKGKTVTVTVTDNGDGTLSATADSTADEPLQFTNTYSVEPITAEFPVEKILSVPDDLEGPAEWEYTFNVAADKEGTPVAESMTANVDQDNTTATFRGFSFTKPGEYTYTVTETGKVAGVTNDTAATSGKKVTITVVDNGDGTLTATADSTEEAPLTFTNTYGISPATVSFPVEKELKVPEGLTGPAEWEFTINVAANDGAPEAATMTGTVNQTKDTVTFSGFSFNKPGKYTYTVTETGTVAGVKNDDAATTGKTVTVDVVDNGNGTLTATADYTADKPLKFTNTYGILRPATAEFPVKKELKVPEELTGPETWTYTFNVAASEGAPVATSMSGVVTNEKDTVTFGDFSFNKPGDYIYTVTETGNVAGVTNDAEATTGKIVTISVVDNGNGTLSATADSTADEPLTFTNTYGTDPAPVETKTYFTKKVVGMRPGAESETFSFTLEETTEGSEGEVLDADVTANKAGEYQIDFGTLRFDKPGTHTYTLTEVLDNLDGGWVVTGSPAENVTINVTDNGAGKLVAEVSKVNITNTFETVTVKGEKTWNDTAYLEYEGYERPESITVDLFADDGEEPIDSVEVTPGEDNKWTFEFTDLPKYKNHGTEIEYSVEEQVPAGFEATDGELDYDIVNTPKRDDEDELNPTTITVKKVDALTEAGEDGEKAGIAGAQFTLSSELLEEDETYTTGADGTVDITFEKDGTYTLTETAAPVGYQLPDPAPSYTITVDKQFIKEVKLNADKNVWTWIYDLIADVNADFDEEEMTLTVADTPKKTQITVEKTWDDANDQDGLRAATNAKVQLYKTPAGGTKVAVGEAENVVVTGTNTWSKTYTDLPAYEDGKQLTYTVEEVLEGNEYSKVIAPASGIAADPEKEDNGTITVVNTHNVKTTELTVNKKWVDFENKYETETPITVQLKADGENYGAPVTISERNNWTYTWTDLEINQKKTAAGREPTEVQYTVEEAAVDGYATTYGQVTKAADGTYSVEVTNTLQNYEVTITKTFEGLTLKRLPKDFAITATYESKEGAKAEKVLYLKDAEPSEDKMTYTWKITEVPFGSQVSVVESGAEVIGYELTPTMPKAINIGSDNTKNLLAVKNEYTPNFGDLKITKALESYAASEGKTTFVFSVVAKVGETKVYDDVVSIDFEKAGTDSVLIEKKIPVGATVEVKEIYSSGSYDVVGSDTVKDLKIVKDETAEAKFTNTYNDNLNQGYGILNEYTTADGTEWAHN